jgi:hypothetical protein
MKYLKSYKIFESLDIKHEIEDILSEINDMQYEVKVYFNKTHHHLEINISNKSYPDPFDEENLSEITETIGRLYDYMKDHKEYGNVPHSVYLTNYGGLPYNTPGKRRLTSWVSIDGRYSDFSWSGVIGTGNFNRIEINYRK